MLITSWTYKTVPYYGLGKYISINIIHLTFRGWIKNFQYFYIYVLIAGLLILLDHWLYWTSCYGYKIFSQTHICEQNEHCKWHFVVTKGWIMYAHVFIYIHNTTEKITAMYLSPNYIKCSWQPCTLSFDDMIVLI